RAVVCGWRTSSSSSCSRCWWAPWSVWWVGSCWWRPCAGCGCPARGCTRCGRWRAPRSSMAPRPSLTAPAFWPGSLPGALSAVFLAGMLIGDVLAPYKSELEQFNSVLASLAEIAAFIALGVTVSLHAVFGSGAWVTGLGLAALLALVVRPLVVGPLLLPIRLGGGERVFVLSSGLKGAFPLLPAPFVVFAGLADAARVYNVVFVVVAFSVIVQGSLVPLVAARLRVP